MKDHGAAFASWGVERIFVDEYHLLFQEIFRHSNSWCSLQNISRLGTKIICLSATSNKNVTEMTAHYLGISKTYQTIGDVHSYTAPNVAILLKCSQAKDLIADVTRYVVFDFSYSLFVCC